MNKQQILLLSKLGVVYNPEVKWTDEELVEIEEKVGDYLSLHCLDNNYNITEEGKICESILDMINTF